MFATLLTEQVTNAIVVIIVGVVLGVSNRLGQRKTAAAVKEKLDKHDERVEEDRETRNQTLHEIQSDQVALKTQQNIIHALVNSSVLELKRQFMIATDTLARIVPTTENKRIAVASAIAYAEQASRQAEVDSTIAGAKQRALIDLHAQTLINPMAPANVLMIEPPGAPSTPSGTAPPTL
jgi:hypothetical protein